MSQIAFTDRRSKPIQAVIAWLLTLFTLGYFLPWAIAASRGKSNTLAIGLLNFLVGWTVIGWVIALVMACGPHGMVQPAYGQAPYGQAPYGQGPYGQAPYGQLPTQQQPALPPPGYPTVPPPASRPITAAPALPEQARQEPPTQPRRDEPTLHLQRPPYDPRV